MDDLISKRTVIDFIEYHIEHPSENFDLRDLIEEIKDEPSATPKQRTGHWIESRCDMYECSNCGNTYTDLSGEKDGMNYCPNCGAKMEVEHEDR